MSHTAVIYIRTSSETQGEKSSPIEQEVDCRRLAQEKGLSVVRVYWDVERCRVGNQLVEPSGSRSDRPALKAMLKDATRDEDERHQVFMLKKHIVDRVLVEVRIDENRDIHVKFRTDFLG